MITKYIQVAANWLQNNISNYPSINAALHSNGNWYTAENTRNEHPELFNGNEVVHEFDSTEFINNGENI